MNPSKRRFIRSYELLIEAEFPSQDPDNTGVSRNTFSVGSVAGDISKPSGRRIVFNGNQSVYGGLNKLDISIYNLSESKRAAMVKDDTDENIIKIQLRVGYQDNIAEVFVGTVFIGRNEREGADIITKIECIDGLLATKAYSNDTITPSVNVYEFLSNKLSGVNIGKIEVPSILSRPVVMMGNTLELLVSKIPRDYNFFIMNEKSYIVKEGEKVFVEIPVVNSDTGLIGSPTVKADRVSFKTVINPKIKSGSVISLESNVVNVLNGDYLVKEVNYSGDNFGQDWYQVVTCDPYKF